MPRLTLRLLGPPLVELDGQPVQLGRHKAVALLAYLALTRQPHSRDALATLLWPELDQSHARGQLRRTLSLLNRTLGEGWLVVDRETAAWAADAQAWIDVEVLRERLAACATHGHPPDQACADCIPLLAEAVDLYRDGFLAGFTLPDAPAFDEWQFFEGEGLRDEVSNALQRLACWYGDRGEYDAAIPYARRWLSQDPLHEPAQRELMALYARSGQRAAALRQYGECERVLQEELGILPAAETTELYEAIRMGQDLPAVTPTEGAVSSELPTRSRHNLPEQLTPFVGREKELGELGELLAPTAEARLVTVVGPGGIGKTRLALEAASRQLAHYPDGVWFVSLASVQSAEAIVPAVAQVLGVSFSGAEPPSQQLLHYLREKRMLLVLDNLEHLLKGVDVLVGILRTAPGVRLLVTSRVGLSLRGEQVITLQGLGYPKMPVGVPGAEDVRRYDSVALFARGARRVRSTFQLTEEELPHVARICQLAQGMPLAILLAAAWVPALTPAKIAIEMERSLDFLAADWRDEPERHHSMRAAFDGTWGTLTERERQAFARLSVFRGGFTREAAQAVTEADLRTLISLVSKSLLQRDRGGRYEVHELLRQYAEARLDERPADKERTLDLHCATYVGFVQCSEMEAWKGELQAFLPELDNVRAAWQHAVARRRVADILSLLHNLSEAAYKGPWSVQEAIDLCAQAVATLRRSDGEALDQEEKVVLGMALAVQGYYCEVAGDADRGRELIREGLAILRELGPRRELAFCLNAALAHGTVSDPAERSRLFDQALAVSTEVDDYPRICWAISCRAKQALVDGAVREAEEGFHQVLALSRQLDSQSLIGWALVFLGHVAFARGQYARAREYYAQSLAALEASGKVGTIGRLHQHLGDVSLALNEYQAAREHHAQALTGYQDMGVTWLVRPAVWGGCYGVPVTLQTLGDIALLSGDDDLARQHYQQALQGALDHPAEELRLHLLLGPARLCAQRGDPERATELVALARHHPASIEETRGKAGELLDGLRAELLPGAYAAAEARGQARDMEATMRELLAELGPRAGSEAISGGSDQVEAARAADAGGYSHG